MRSFKSAFCQANKTSSEHFEKVLLVRACRFHVRPLVWFLVRIFPGTFKKDVDILSRIGQSDTKQELSSDAGSLQNFHRHELPIWRRFLGLRMSVGRLLSIVSRVHEFAPDEL